MQLVATGYEVGGKRFLEVGCTEKTDADLGVRGGIAIVPKILFRERSGDDPSKFWSNVHTIAARHGFEPKTVRALYASH